MVIDEFILEQLSMQAKASTRLRMHYDLRDSVEDESQRMLNAIKPGTIIPVHRHTMTIEDVVILRGLAEDVFYDKDGNASRLGWTPRKIGCGAGKEFMRMV